MNNSLYPKRGAETNPDTRKFLEAIYYGEASELLHLSREEMEKLKAWEAPLGEVLENLYEVNVKETQLYMSYFETPKGKAKLQEAFPTTTIISSEELKRSAKYLYEYIEDIENAERDPDVQSKYVDIDVQPIIDTLKTDLEKKITSLNQSRMRVISTGSTVLNISEIPEFFTNNIGVFVRYFTKINPKELKIIFPEMIFIKELKSFLTDNLDLLHRYFSTPVGIGKLQELFPSAKSREEMDGDLSGFLQNHTSALAAFYTTQEGRQELQGIFAPTPICFTKNLRTFLNNNIRILSEYFDTPSKHAELQTIFASIDVSSVQDMGAFFEEYEEFIRDKPAKIRAELTKLSRNYVEKELLRQLKPRVSKTYTLEIKNSDGMVPIKLPKRFRMLINEQEIDNKLLSLYSFKNTLRREVANIETDTSGLGLAKKELLKLFQKKTNHLLANIKHAILHKDSHTQDRQRARYSKFIYGASDVELEIRSTGKILGKDRSVIPAVVKRSTNEQIQQLLTSDKVENANMKALGLDPNKLRDDTPGSPYAFSSEQVRLLAERLIDAYGELSTEPASTFDIERTGPAVDDKWQAVINPKITALSIDPARKVLSIPPDRTYNVISVISVVLGHELEGHMLQALNKKNVPLRLFQKVGGDRAMLWSEMGAMYNQARVAQECFGKIPSAAPTYVSAMLAKEKGGNYLDVVKAMIDVQADFVATLPESKRESEKEKILKRAINRAFRLFNGVDDFEHSSTRIPNTKDTAYMEQRILMSFLQEMHMENLAFLGGMNLETVAVLMKLGILNKDDVMAPKNVAQQIWSEMKDKYRLSKDKIHPDVVRNNLANSLLLATHKVSKE